MRKWGKRWGKSPGGCPGPRLAPAIAVPRQQPSASANHHDALSRSYWGRHHRFQVRIYAGKGRTMTLIPLFTAVRRSGDLPPKSAYLTGSLELGAKRYYNYSYLCKLILHLGNKCRKGGGGSGARN